MANPIIVITLDNDKEIKCELYPEVAPKTVANFVKLVNEKFYDGVIFHRVIDNFMIQTGGYYLEGNSLVPKDDVDTIPGEFTSNGFKNDLKHTLGVLSMARTSDPNSASGQFFICSADTPHLDGAYAAFGKVIEGIENVLEVSGCRTVNIGGGFTDFPYPPKSIKSIILK